MRTKDRRQRPVGMDRCGPTGKRRWASQQGAATALTLIRARDNGRRAAVPQRVYACSKCGGFHLSSKAAQ